MKVIINCGKSDILKRKQVVSLAKRISNKFNALNLHHQHPHAVCNCLLFFCEVHRLMTVAYYLVLPLINYVSLIIGNVSVMVSLALEHKVGKLV